MWRFWKKNFWISLKKKFCSAYAQSPRKCSNIEILAKIEGKETKFFFEKIYEGHKRIWFRSKKNSKIISCCVPLKLFFSCYGHFWGWKKRPLTNEAKLTLGGFIKGILRGVRCTKSLRVLILHRRPPSWTTLVLYSRAVFIFNEPAYYAHTVRI